MSLIPVPLRRPLLARLVRCSIGGATLTLWSAAVLSQAVAPAGSASAPAPAAETTLPTVSVKATGDPRTPTEQSGAYKLHSSTAATGLGLSARETPQSVSVITRSQMSDFRLNSVNDALDASTGVVVEKVETDRTYYTARGFDIVNFQHDGIGLPFVYGLVDGDLDTATYDRVEVVRGANGLMTGVGNPSATINFVRKRPTPSLQASAGLSVGSWNDHRVDADVSGPLNAAKTLRGRLVLAAQDKDSYLDRYHLKKGVAYGVLEADLGDATVLTLGHTQQNNRPRGGMWGALPLVHNDGTPTNYDVSTSTAPAWTYWNTDTGVSFAEIQHLFANGWQGTAVFTHKKVASRGKLFYAYGTPDAATGLGVASWPSLYDLDNTQDMLDLRASGPLQLGGRTHELVVGASISRSKLVDHSTFGEGIGTALPDLATWDGSYPEPVFDIDGGGSRFIDRQRSLYAAARVNVSDTLKLIVGANATSVTSEGESYGESSARGATKVAPYVGAVIDLTPTTSVYGSHTVIFNPQSQIGGDLKPLAPVTGSNDELGIKAELLDKQLDASLAVFKSRQDNLATFDKSVGMLSTYKGVDTVSQGVELELAGALSPHAKISAGYTQLAIKDGDGNPARTFSPRQVLRLSGTYKALPRLKLGASLNWRSGTWRYADDGVSEIHQRSYALLNLMARYDFNQHLSATLNLNNVGNEKYLTSLYWTQAYYGAPRNGSLSLNWTY